MEPQRPVSFATSSSLFHNTDNEPVRTLFVRGLPDDVKNREIHNLFRPHRGYVSCTVNKTGERQVPIAFVTFTDQASAIAAQNQLQGIRVDPDLSLTLRIELAKSNSKSKQRKNQKVINRAPTRNGVSIFSPKEKESVPQIEAMLSFLDMNEDFEEKKTTQKTLSTPTASPQNGARVPCSTIFIGNLKSDTDEEQLGEVLTKTLTGCERIKFNLRDDSKMCWIDFNSITNSSNALKLLQGTTFDTQLNPADGKGIRIEFAKSQMGPKWKNN